jgi:hypothetical protein
MKEFTETVIVNLNNSNRITKETWHWLDKNIGECKEQWELKYIDIGPIIGYLEFCFKNIKDKLLFQLTWLT